jgi:hypothetical protein
MMNRARSQTRVLRRARTAIVFAVVAAVIPAALVVLGVEAVPTMLIPVLVSAMPLLGRTPTIVRRLSLVATMLMTVFVLLGGFSVGFLFVPSLVALMVAVLVANESPATA